MNDTLQRRLFVFALVAVIVGAIYLGCTVSPPSLMDDVDAVQAQIAKTMLTSGDWVTARLDGVLYLEKSSAHLLADRDFLQNLWRRLLGCAAARGPFFHWSCPADRGVRHVGSSG